MTDHPAPVDQPTPAERETEATLALLLGATMLSDDDQAIVMAAAAGANSDATGTFCTHGHYCLVFPN